MNLVDLHTHSTHSDGTFAPKELVRYAKEKGLTAIALTDHDTVSGAGEAKQAGKELGIEVISGVELSTDYSDIEIHIVGLFIDDKNEYLLKELEELRTKRNERNGNMINRLRELGIDINLDDVIECSGGKVISRAHIAKALVKKGYAGSINEAFERYIGAGKPAYIKRENLSWRKSFELIHNSGGVAVLAHPLQYKLGTKFLQQMLSDLSDGGLNAIEVYYSTHTSADIKYVKRLADMYGLAYSGGSDFHGENKPKLDLGCGYGKLEVREEILDNLKKLRGEING